jgi:hypothetical protein
MCAMIMPPRYVTGWEMQGIRHIICYKCASSTSCLCFWILQTAESLSMLHVNPSYCINHKLIKSGKLLPHLPHFAIDSGVDILYVRYLYRIKRSQLNIWMDWEQQCRQTEGLGSCLDGRAFYSSPCPKNELRAISFHIQQRSKCIDVQLDPSQQLLDGS